MAAIYTVEYDSLTGKWYLRKRDRGHFTNDPALFDTPEEAQAEAERRLTPDQRRARERLTDQMRPDWD